MLNNELEFILSDIKTYYEFDKENFVSSAQSSLTGNPVSINSDVNLSSYSDMITNTLSDLDNMHIDKGQMIEFFASCSKGLTDTVASDIQGISASDVTSIKPQYLNDFMTNIGLIINRTLNGEDTRSDLDRLISADITGRVKRQIVKTSLPYVYDAKKLANIDNTKRVRVDPEYIQSAIIPFIKSYDSAVANLHSDAVNCVSAITKCEKEIENYQITLDKIQKTENLSPEVIKKVNYVTYNAFRALIDVVSFMSFMLIRKINSYTSNIQACTSLYTLLTNSGEMTENVYNGVSLFPLDTHSLCEELIKGQSDAFDEIANSIYEFNIGIIENSPESPANILDKGSILTADAAIDNAEYDTTKYDEANKMYTIINKGLDIISQYSDDYLLVFDDIVSKAGFELELSDRFKSDLEVLDDISEYTSAVSLPTYSELVYYKMLHEVKDYPKNMNTLASVISDCKARVDMLTKRFNDNINGDFENAEAVNELKIFMEGFLEQLIKLTNQVAAKFMLRLKGIGLAIDNMNILRKREKNAIVRGNNSDIAENVSFNDGLCEDVIVHYEAFVDAMFEEMTRQYLSAKAYKDRGAILVFEDAETNNGGQTTQTNNNNGQSKSKTFIEYLNTWFNKLTQKLTGLVESASAKRDQEYLNRAKQELLSKDYSNITTSQPVYNYESIHPYGNMQKDLNKVLNNVNTTNLQKLNGAGDSEAVMNAVFGDTVPKELWNNGKVADAVTAYYKFGKTPNAQPSTIAGSQLKTLVQNAIDYCDGFYTKKIKDIRDTTENIKKNLETVINTMVTESVCDVDFMTFVLEDGENNNNNGGQSTTNNQSTPQNQQQTQQNQPAQNNNNQNNGNNNNGNNGNAKTTTNMADKVNTVNKNITFYCSGIITAAFDRYKDYMNLLHSLVADNGGNNNNN